MILAEYTGLLPHYNLPQLANPVRYHDEVYLAARLLAITVTLLLAEAMASSISARLRARTGDLLRISQSHEAKSRELEEANDKLRKLDAARTRFIATVTHELRAPVGAIVSTLELAQVDYIPAEKQQEMVRRAQARAHEMLDLIRDLLELSKARQLGDYGQRQPVQLATLLENVVDLMRVEAENKDLLLSADVAPDVPPVLADAGQMKSVWTNLISNAIKYTESGGIIVVSLKEEDGSVLGTVRDTGIGIAAEDLPKVFEEFYRTDQAKARVQRGTGVGLAIVKRIVESYDGKVWVESELGNGSKFSFSLPKAHSQPDGVPLQAAG
jgi:signal transduction histidine kinase